MNLMFSVLLQLHATLHVKMVPVLQLIHVFVQMDTLEIHVPLLVMIFDKLVQFHAIVVCVT